MGHTSSYEVEPARPKAVVVQEDHDEKCHVTILLLPVVKDEELFSPFSGYLEDMSEFYFKLPLLLTVLGTPFKWEHSWLFFADLRELLGLSSNCSAYDFSFTDNKAAALLMLTKSVDLVKDAHEEVEQVRGPLSLLVFGRQLCDQ